MSFPVAGTLMIEPTESESLPELDRFINSMVEIRKEIQEVIEKKMDENNNPLKIANRHSGDIAIKLQNDNIIFKEGDVLISKITRESINMLKDLYRDEMSKSDWDMSTNLNAAMDKILDVAVKGSVPASDMPAMLLILSDMQFNQCARYDDSAMEMIERKFEAAGYSMPQIVFWNLNSSDNVPVKADKSGAALVSGFSPSIMTSLLAADLDQFTPEGIMLKTVMSDRYAL
jgi:hypothetical protein